MTDEIIIAETPITNLIDNPVVAVVTQIAVSVAISAAAMLLTRKVMQKLDERKFNDIEA